MTSISMREDLIAFKAGLSHRDFWDGLYTSEIDRQIVTISRLMDVVALWTRNDDDLPDLDQNLAKLERIRPRARTSGMLLVGLLGRQEASACCPHEASVRTWTKVAQERSNRGDSLSLE